MCSMAAELRWQQLLAFVTRNLLELEVPVGQKQSEMHYVLQQSLQNIRVVDQGAKHFCAKRL